MASGKHCYLIALGSNRRLPNVGSPRAVLDAAVAELGRQGWQVEAVSRWIDSIPLGPSLRRYVNGAAIIAGDLDPLDALENLQSIEARFGRERRGQRWRSRTLDLDIVLWNGGAWHSSRLTVPHPQFRQRSFVLGPCAEIAPKWRDPVSGWTVRQLAKRTFSQA